MLIAIITYTEVPVWPLFRSRHFLVSFPDPSHGGRDWTHCDQQVVPTPRSWRGQSDSLVTPGTCRFKLKCCCDVMQHVSFQIEVLLWCHAARVFSNRLLHSTWTTRLSQRVQTLPSRAKGLGTRLDTSGWGYSLDPSLSLYIYIALSTKGLGTRYSICMTSWLSCRED